MGRRHQKGAAESGSAAASWRFLRSINMPVFAAFFRCQWDLGCRMTVTVPESAIEPLNSASPSQAECRDADLFADEGQSTVEQRPRQEHAAAEEILHNRPRRRNDPLPSSTKHDTQRADDRDAE
jgi:hypothetical protein